MVKEKRSLSYFFLDFVSRHGMRCTVYFKTSTVSMSTVGEVCNERAYIFACFRVSKGALD